MPLSLFGAAKSAGSVGQDLWFRVAHTPMGDVSSLTTEPCFQTDDLKELSRNIKLEMKCSSARHWKKCLLQSLFASSAGDFVLLTFKRQDSKAQPCYPGQGHSLLNMEAFN